MAKISKASRDKLVTIRERYKLAYDADHENRQKAIEDMKFCYEPGEQWQDTVVKARGARPCYEFNKVRISVKRVVNDMRANRPAGKVRGQEDGDKDTADVLEGLVRNIWNVSDGDTVIDQAAEYQVAGGMGAWRVSVDYASDEAFEQDIRVETIRNPYNLAIIREAAKVPVIVDAGVGTASDAAIAMELGCDGVLMNTAIAGAKDPVRMARAMKLAVEAGREAFLAGRIPRKFAASPSSPMAGRVA